jgi:hypothetical protein
LFEKKHGWKEGKEGDAYREYMGRPVENINQ